MEPTEYRDAKGRKWWSNGTVIPCELCGKHAWQEGGGVCLVCKREYCRRCHDKETDNEFVACRHCLPALMAYHHPSSS